MASLKLCINKLLWDGRLARPVWAFRPTLQENLFQHFSLATLLQYLDFVQNSNSNPR